MCCRNGASGPSPMRGRYFRENFFLNSCCCNPCPALEAGFALCDPSEQGQGVEKEANKRVWARKTQIPSQVTMGCSVLAVWVRFALICLRLSDQAQVRGCSGVCSCKLCCVLLWDGEPNRFPGDEQPAESSRGLMHYHSCAESAWRARV